jgi:hypothetical protein
MSCSRLTESLPIREAEALDEGKSITLYETLLVESVPLLSNCISSTPVSRFVG